MTEGTLPKAQHYRKRPELRIGRQTPGDFLRGLADPICPLIPTRALAFYLCPHDDLVYKTQPICTDDDHAVSFQHVRHIHFELQVALPKWCSSEMPTGGGKSVGRIWTTDSRWREWMITTRDRTPRYNSKDAGCKTVTHSHSAGFWAEPA